MFVSGELQVLKVGQYAKNDNYFSKIGISKILLQGSEFFRYDMACSP